MAPRPRSEIACGAALFALGMTTGVVACTGRRAPAEEQTLAPAPETQSARHGAQTANGDSNDAAFEETLAQKAKKYARGLLPDGSIIRGTLQEGARSDHLLVLRGGYCYRILGVGGDGVEDMDLFLYDPDGVQTQQDPGQDRFPVLGLQVELCPAASGAFRLQTLMYKGGGAYAVRIYRTPM
jgi:hypothetical protein